MVRCLIERWFWKKSNNSRFFVAIFTDKISIGAMVVIGRKNDLAQTDAIEASFCIFRHHVGQFVFICSYILVKMIFVIIACEVRDFGFSEVFAIKNKRANYCRSHC